MELQTLPQTYFYTSYSHDSHSIYKKILEILKKNTVIKGTQVYLVYYFHQYRNT